MGLSLRDFWRIVKSEADAKRLTIRSICQSLHRRHFEVLSDGKVVTQTGEAGGSVEFSFAPGFGMDQVAKLGSKLLDWVESHPDPDNPSPNGPREITRYRVTFNRARP